MRRSKARAEVNAGGRQRGRKTHHAKGARKGGGGVGRGEKTTRGKDGRGDTKGGKKEKAKEKKKIKTAQKARF